VAVPSPARPPPTPLPSSRLAAINNTFGVPGVSEHTFFLKELADARAIRTRLLRNVEMSGFAGLPEAERKRLLSVVIIGGGPTGVEFAAEAHDLVREDVARMWPQVHKDVSITIIEGKSILGSFDASLREYAERKFKRDSIRVRTGANVVAVTPTEVVLSDGERMPYGVAVWNTGIGARPLIKSLDSATWRKDRWGHLITNASLRCLAASTQEPVGGSGGGTGTDLERASVVPGVFAMGDCASVSDHKLAATAQVAEQQGRYAAREMNAALQRVRARLGPGAPVEAIADGVAAEPWAEPFRYKHGGSLAFLGTFTAISDFTQGSALAPLYSGEHLKGFTSWVLWRSAYLTKLGSWMKRVQVPADWTRTLLFGRDVTVF